MISHYIIEPEELHLIKKVKDRLYDMKKMDSDDMRDNAALLTLFIDAMIPIEE